MRTAIILAVTAAVIFTLAACGGGNATADEIAQHDADMQAGQAAAAAASAAASQAIGSAPGWGHSFTPAPTCSASAPC